MTAVSAPYWTIEGRTQMGAWSHRGATHDRALASELARIALNTYEAARVTEWTGRVVEQLERVPQNAAGRP